MGFTSTELRRMQRAIDLLVRGSAYELPFDAEVAHELGFVAASNGFEPAMRFEQDVRDKPISTLLNWLSAVGNSATGNFLVTNLGEPLITNTGVNLVWR